MENSEGYEVENDYDYQSSNDGSAFNGYYGADGGFHEYNNGWEGE